MMQVILRGLTEDACEISVTEILAPFCHVTRVHMVREGDPDRPWAVIHVTGSYERIWRVCKQLTGLAHRGRRLHFYIPLHQSDIYHEFA